MEPKTHFSSCGKKSVLINLLKYGVSFGKAAENIVSLFDILVVYTVKLVQLIFKNVASEDIFWLYF